MAGLTAAPDVTVDGCTMNASCVAAAGLTVTVAVWVMPTPPTVAETAFAWATVEASVPLVTPFASVTPGCTKLLPLPVAARVTALPRITLPKRSRAVTVSELALLPVDAVIVAGDATTLVWDAFTESGTESAVKINGDPTPVAWAVWVLSVGVLRVPRVQLVAATPLAFVTELVGFTEPPPPNTDQLMVTPGTALLNASLATTESGVGSVRATVSVWRLPPLTAIWVAPPTCAVTLNVTVVGVAPIVAVAVVVSDPGVTPSVRVACPCPPASVWEVGGLTDPPP